MGTSDCSVYSCTMAVKVKGYCKPHYMSYWRHGDPLYVGKQGNMKHGGYNTPEHRSWMKMKQRCYDTNNNRYYRYGGRGITVCDRWLDQENGFVSFLKDMGNKPDGYSVERKDNNGNYTPDNCVWADTKTQSRNKSTTKIYKGKCMKEWSEYLRTPYAAFAWRVKKHGWVNAINYKAGTI